LVRNAGNLHHQFGYCSEWPNPSSPELHQEQTLIANCASAATAIAKLLKRLQKSEKNKGDQNG